MSNITDPAPDTSPAATDPVERDIVVRAPIDTCFRVFVDDFATWWPSEHHIGDDRTITNFVIEPFVGGRCHDVDTTGFECQWGTVLDLDRPNRLVIAWHIQGDWTIDLDPALQSEITVTFTALDDHSTQVRLVHDRLERHGSGAIGVRTGVSSPGGWGGLLLRFGDVAEGHDARPLPT